MAHTPQSMQPSGWMMYNSLDLPLIVSTGHFSSQTVQPIQVSVMKYAMNVFFYLIRPRCDHFEKIFTRNIPTASQSAIAFLRAKTAGNWEVPTMEIGGSDGARTRNLCRDRAGDRF